MIRIFQRGLVFEFVHETGTLEVIYTILQEEVGRYVVYFNGCMTDIEWPVNKPKKKRNIKHFLDEAVFGFSRHNKEKVTDFIYGIYPELAL